MERLRPGQSIGLHAGTVVQHLAGDGLEALRHPRRGASREGHQQNAPRIGDASNAAIFSFEVDATENGRYQRVGYRGWPSAQP